MDRVPGAQCSMSPDSRRALQQVLRQCHSRQELIRTARQLGYRVTKGDLQNAWLEHHKAAEVQGADGADLWAAGGS